MRRTLYLDCWRRLASSAGEGRAIGRNLGSGLLVDTGMDVGISSVVSSLRVLSVTSSSPPSWSLKTFCTPNYSFKGPVMLSDYYQLLIPSKLCNSVTPTPRESISSHSLKETVAWYADNILSPLIVQFFFFSNLSECTSEFVICGPQLVSINKQ